MSLVAARRLATEVHRQRAFGNDVIADHVAAKRRRRFESQTKAGSTFAAAVRDYIEHYAKKKRRRWEEQSRILGLMPTADGLEMIRGGIAERWADKPIADVTDDDIDALVDEARVRGIPGLEKRKNGPNETRAEKMFSTLSRLFSWLVDNRKLYRLRANPCATLKKPDAAPSRDRVLTDAEVVAFWAAAGMVSEPFGALFKILLLTGARLNEVARMTRAELSEDGTTWNLPATRTKNKKPHTVPLPPLAREILATVKPIAGKPGYVFTTTGRSPVSGFSKMKARLDAAMKIPPWRLHDLRRTFVTGAAELGIRPDVIELAINHISGHRGGIAGIYNRSELLPERRAALERWAAHIERLVTGHGAKVVSLRGGAS